MNQASPCAVPLSSGPQHHFHGYYGINPWDPSLRYHLALETRTHEHRPTPGDVAAVGLFDRQTGSFQPYASTSAFNLQQGSMMHWIDVGLGAEFTYNDWEGGRLVWRAVRPPDGHASYSADRRWLVTDTSGMMRGDHIERELMLYDVECGTKISLGIYCAAPHLTGDIRCDLHPRWSPDGRTITFDSVHTGDRQIYLIDVSPYLAQ